MVRIEKTVFISYRRKDISWALAVYQDLTHQGYDVFFDYTSIPAGDFEQIIVSNIKARAHFVVILTPTTLDRCSEPGDWLRREIEKAIDEKRNIIPLFFDGFSFGAKNVSEKLTGKLMNVSRYNGMNIHHDYFREGMERLRNTFLNVPLDTVLHPVSEEVQEVVNGEQFAANQALKVEPAPQPTQVIEKPKPARAVTPPNKPVLSNGMEFVHVPAGSFIMGSNNGNDKGNPQHTVVIPYDYWMARYPVTNVQYAVYVKAKGIVHPNSYWHSKKDHPITMVSWNEVMEYCKWLSTLLKAELPSGKALRLPTEAEWEKAARGEYGREYPWGNTFDKNKFNWNSEKPGDTTPVGTYSPQGDSPYGCADMASNVWEWTHSEDKEYPYIANDGREDEQKDVKRVLRGGAGRCASRGVSKPDLKTDFFNIFGFRVVVASPLHP